MQRTHVLRRATPPTAVLLVCFVSATLLGVAGVTPSAQGQTTENEAAQYITAMTRMMRSGVSDKSAKPKLVAITAKKSAARAPAAKGLAIAASAARPTKPHRKTKTKSSPKKK